MADSYDPEFFGHADRVMVTKDRTTILGGKGDAENRAKELEAQLPNLLKAFEKDQIKERIAKLRSGIGVIRVAGITEAEREERKKAQAALQEQLVRQARLEERVAAINAAMLAVDRLSPDGVSKLFAPDHAGAILRLGSECSARLRTMKGGG